MSSEPRPDQIVTILQALETKVLALEWREAVLAVIGAMLLLVPNNERESALVAARETALRVARRMDADRAGLVQ